MPSLRRTHDSSRRRGLRGCAELERPGTSGKASGTWPGPRDGEYPGHLKQRLADTMLAERDTAVQLARHLDADLGLLARACGDDAAAARCASVARCLAAVVKCAPFASGAIPGLASRFVDSLQAARPAVSDGDAWDDLGHDLGGAVVRAVPFDDAFPDAFGALAQRYAAAAAEALDSFAAEDASTAGRRRAAKRARKHCDRFAHLLERCLQNREREASLVLDALVVHQRCAGPLRPLKSAADKARKALRAALAARPPIPGDDAKEGARVDECRSKLCKALSRVAAFSRRPEAPRLAAVESDDAADYGFFLDAALLDPDGAKCFDGCAPASSRGDCWRFLAARGRPVVATRGENADAAAAAKADYDDCADAVLDALCARTWALLLAPLARPRARYTPPAVEVAVDERRDAAARQQGRLRRLAREPAGDAAAAAAAGGRFGDGAYHAEARPARQRPRRSPGGLRRLRALAAVHRVGLGDGDGCDQLAAWRAEVLGEAARWLEAPAASLRGRHGAPRAELAARLADPAAPACALDLGAELAARCRAALGDARDAAAALDATPHDGDARRARRALSRWPSGTTPRAPRRRPRAPRRRVRGVRARVPLRRGPGDSGQGSGARGPFWGGGAAALERLRRRGDVGFARPLSTSGDARRRRRTRAVDAGRHARVRAALAAACRRNGDASVADGLRAAVAARGAAADDWRLRFGAPLVAYEAAKANPGIPARSPRASTPRSTRPRASAVESWAGVHAVVVRAREARRDRKSHADDMDAPSSPGAALHAASAAPASGWARAARDADAAGELALGARTRSLLRGAELCVDDLQQIATLPDDRWRAALNKAVVRRLEDAALVLKRELRQSVLEVKGGESSEPVSKERLDELVDVACLKRKCVAAPARRALEKAAEALLRADAPGPGGRDPYGDAFDRKARAAVDAARSCLDDPPRPAVLAYVKRVLKQVDKKKAAAADGDDDDDDAVDSFRAALDAFGELRGDARADAGWEAETVAPRLSDGQLLDAVADDRRGASASEHDCEVHFPVSGGDGGFCRVARLVEHVVPLNSKTRPKKLTFACGDGSRRSFLLKGAEDVHLDERVMQLLTTIREAVALAAKGGFAPHVSTYAVLPLSRSSGLIEWVPQTRPLIDLYRDATWSRGLTSAIAERQAKLTKNGEEPEKPEASSKRSRASKKKRGRRAAEADDDDRPDDRTARELQYEALPKGFHAELTKRGVDASAPRQQWDAAAVRASYDALARDAPRDMVERELARWSEGGDDWCARRRTYAARLGGSCVANYALGLGDRHLENVLLDVRDGSVVDVDWGVCFDAGTRLRVPEAVPFRLTPALRFPLGPAGCAAGPFAAAARKTARALGGPAGAAVLELLEVVANDARVEWRATLGHGKRLKGPEDGQGAPAAPHHDRFATLALSAARCFEQRRKLVADGLHRGDVLAAALDARSAALDALAVAQGGHGDAGAQAPGEVARTSARRRGLQAGERPARGGGARHAGRGAGAPGLGGRPRGALGRRARGASAAATRSALLASPRRAVVGELNKRGAVLLAAGSVSTADGSNAPPLPLGQLREIFARQGSKRVIQLRFNMSVPRARVQKRIHAPFREMIARPKISANEWKTAEI
ncbi:protein serine/threonine kinase [Aureococcus anophagefferens]|uniref:Protein serine/threonine kinase n=1 Tax=Aureococcus anophagefferens TaxID=44056 RepID=A0ABR1FV94_AURAN